jgi:hypothetical protein
MKEDAILFVANPVKIGYNMGWLMIWRNLHENF